MDSGTTSSITFSTGVGVDPVVGSNYKLNLRGGRDTVTVGGLKVANVALNLITNQTPAFNVDPFSGIQGTTPVTCNAVAGMLTISTLPTGMAATASGFFAGLISQGLPC